MPRPNVKKFLYLIASLFYSFSLHASDNVLTIPEGVLLSSGLDPEFVAKFAFFMALLILWITFMGKVLKMVLHIPVIAGQIIAGVFLGPSLFNIKQLSTFADPFIVFDRATGSLYALASSDIFIIFILMLSSAFTVPYLLWIAGHETDIKDIIKVGFTALTAGFLGAVVPISLTVIVIFYGLGSYFNLVQSFSVGLILAATSVSIPIAVLFAQHKMHLKSSKATLGAAIIDDILAVLLLSIFFILLKSGVFGNFTGLEVQGIGNTDGIFYALVSMAVSFAVIFAFGYYIIPPLIRLLKEKSQTPIIASVANGIMFLYFAFAELIGNLSGITGAYFAGLFHKMGATKRHAAEKVISPFVNAILLPIFLGSIGLQVDIKLLASKQWAIVALLLFVAIASKLGACFLSTFMNNVFGKGGKNRWRIVDSFLFGSSMVARGEVGLVIATILNGKQLITPEQYVISVVVIVLTTIASPMMLSAGFYWLEIVERAERVRYEDVSVDIGRFDIVGTFQMFNIIIGSLEASPQYKTPTVIFSEGQRIASIEENNVKIVYRPDEGIELKGREKEIKKILKMVKKDIAIDIKHISEGVFESQ